MGAFHYTAIDTTGTKQKGLIEAESAKHARQLLREKNLVPLDVTATHEKSSRTALHPSKISRKQSMTVKELALMTRQMATLLSAGLPVEEVLTAVAEQTEKPRTKGVILSVRSKVIEGHALASALREFPQSFSNLYCSTVSAGEKSGHLDIVLNRLADYTEQQHAIRQKIIHALIYPSVMIVVAIGIVGFLLEYVVPKMISVFSNINQKLPEMTQVLLAMSAGIKSYGIYILLGLILLMILFRYQMKKNIRFQEKTHGLILRIPIIGNAIKIINTARFSRTFAILSSAGVSVLEAMTISSKLITNLPIRHAVDEAVKRVREGANIHLALKQTTYFPPMSIHLIASGESSGQLENMLERAANNQDNDITQLIETSLALFEPIIILVMGAIVLFIVLAVLLPIFQLDQFTG
ncbi:MAG TPA: type II secretion system inner membrane protein GspF [Gammaproteobacteria bacterium]|nr:type II secretion system inner membrane protein GspF [Gammaproteobacteria bacterium]